MKYTDDQLHLIYMFASDHRRKYQLVMDQLLHKFRLNELFLELIIYVFIKSLEIDFIILDH